jgi:nitrite reductase/ring-hydroxylating ferredoxin subunit
MSWVKVLPQAELPEGARKVVRTVERSVLLIHNRGKILALQSTCPHMAFPLQFATVTADYGIVCALHHSTFDLRTGDVKDWSPWPSLVGPMLKNVSRRKALRVFPTRVEEGSIWVEVKELS